MSEYKELITKFINNGYDCDFFTEFPEKKGKLILRHDIDFDVQYAYELSLIEDELSVKSTYFFLLHSESYNVLEHRNIERINSIKSRGHQVSIHFDPTIYEDVEAGLKKEKELFESIFDVEVLFISIHRPSEIFLNSESTICGLRHTYQTEYFRQIKYFADSQGLFRFGNPLDSDEFRKRKTIQLLTHPIWWITSSSGPLRKLDEYIDYRIDNIKRHIALNCIPYKSYLEVTK